MANKPTRINPIEVYTKETPLAGHLTEIGEKILTLGARKAVHVTTMDWGIGARSSHDIKSKNEVKNDKTHILIVRP